MSKMPIVFLSKSRSQVSPPGIFRVENLPRKQHDLAAFAVQ